MSKLRMKETLSERAARESETSKKEHRKKKRRKRSINFGDSLESDRQREGLQAGPSTYYKVPDEDEAAYLPGRPSKDRPYIPYAFDDEDDESRLPSQSSYKRDRATEDEEFNQRLFDAMREDEGFPDPYSNVGSRAGLSFDYREGLPDRRAFGASGIADDRFVDPDTGAVVNRVIFKEAMTEDEYAEHIRHGMFRRTRKEELARLAQHELERKAREKRKAEDIARTKALEIERLKKLEERALRKSQAGTIKSREQYQLAWARLVDPKRAFNELRSDDFPWPISIESGGILDKKAVNDFLTSHLDTGRAEQVGQEDGQLLKKKKKKQAIRTAVLAYHPDRFERYVAKLKQGHERESVRQMGLRISQILNELLQDM